MTDLDRSIAEDIGVIRELLARREHAAERLFGSSGKPVAALRSELVREVFCAWVDGRTLRPGAVSRQLSSYATRGTVFNEIKELARLGVLQVSNDEHDKRAKCLLPTDALVLFYRHEMPSLSADFHAATARKGRRR